MAEDGDQGRRRRRECVCRRSNQAALDMMPPELVARPPGVVVAVRRLDPQQTLTRLGTIGGAGLLPERQRVAAVHAVGGAQRGHRAEEDHPCAHVRKVGAGARRVKTKSTQDRTRADGSNGPVDAGNGQIEERPAP